MILKNGMEILYVPNLNSQCINIGMYLRGGAACENNNEYGIYHFLEHLLFRRLGNLSQTELYSKLNSIGADMRGVTYYNLLRFDITVSNQYFRQAVNILPEFYSNFEWNEEELQQEKTVVKNQIFFNSSNSFFRNLEFDYLSGTGFDHPIMGYAKTVDLFTVKQMNLMRNQIFIPENSLIIITGNISQDDINFTTSLLSLIDNKGKSQKGLNRNLPMNFNCRNLKSDRIIKTEGDISEVIISFDIEERADLRLASQLVLHAFAGGNGSVLSLNLKDINGYTDEVFWYFDEYPSFSRGSISFLVRNESLAECLKFLGDIMKNFKNSFDESYFYETIHFFSTNSTFVIDDQREFNFDIAWKKINFQEEQTSVSQLKREFERISVDNFNKCKSELFSSSKIIVSIENNPHIQKVSDVKKAIAYIRKSLS